MRVPIIALLIHILFLACNDSTIRIADTGHYNILRDTQLRNIYIDTFAYTRNVHREWSDSNSFLSLVSAKYRNIGHIGVINPLIYAMYEPFIDTTQIEASKFWFRVTVDPVFRTPYMLIAEMENGQTKITLKTTDGRGGYYPGSLDTEVIRYFGDTTYNSLQEKLHLQNFWSLKQDTSCMVGVDGENWIIEGINQGKYNVIFRWVPEYCGDKATRDIAKTILWLKHVTGMDSMYNAVTKLKSGR
ncbi:hypothetical protein [Flavitalea sp.]|nr:hypothetical protein [Flavitalea sp.]